MWHVYDIAFGAGVGWGGLASQQVPARWGQAPIYCNQASTVEQFQLHMNQRKCEPKRMRDSKMCFYHICACRHTTKIMCAPRGSPTIKWNQDGAARAGKIQAFSTPPSPLSKDTDGICLIRDTISFWHCSKPEPSKCGVGARMNNMWHVISLTKAPDSF